MTHEWLIGALVLGPVALALVLLAGPKGRLRDVLVLLSALATLAAGAAVALRGNATLTLPPLMTEIGSIVEPLMILAVLALGFMIRSWVIKAMAALQLALALAGAVLERGHEVAPTLIVVDQLSTILVLIVSVIGSLIAIYAIGYMRHHEHHAPSTAASTNRFFFFVIAFLGLMNGLVLVDHLKWLAIFWEGTTLCSFFLIGHDGTAEAKASARRALLINAFGGLMMSLAGFLAGRLAGTESIMGSMASPSLALAPLALLAVATMTKSAQMPFQSWLLGAMVAPTPVSALLHSSTMVKAGSYLILRLAPAIDRTPLAPVIAIAGAFTFAAACALAVGQSNGKKVLAYSTIANLGLIAACAALNTPLAFAAALMLLIFHAVTKALLFLCVGTIEQTIGSRHIEDMGGILFKMPLTTSVAIVGMVSMMAPPFGMLIGKWMAIESAIGSPLVLMLFIVGSALTVFFWAKWLGRITTASYHENYKIEKVSPWQSAVLVSLALAVIAGSLAGMPIYHYIVKPISLAVFGALGGGAAMTLLDSVESFMAWPIFVILGVVLLAIAISSLSFRRSHLRLPFLCGENVAGGAFSFEFRSVADRTDKALLNSYYLSKFFGEGAITTWCNPVAAIIILTLFGVIIPGP